MGVEREKEKHPGFSRPVIMDGFLLRHTDRRRGRDGERDERKEGGRKSKRGAMAFGRSVINKGPETHSDPVIDLTTGVKINTQGHTHTYPHTHTHTLKWAELDGVCELYTTPHPKQQ